MLEQLYVNVIFTKLESWLLKHKKPVLLSQRQRGGGRVILGRIGGTGVLWLSALTWVLSADPAGMWSSSRSCRSDESAKELMGGEQLLPLPACSAGPPPLSGHQRRPALPPADAAVAPSHLWELSFLLSKTGSASHSLAFSVQNFFQEV